MSETLDALLIFPADLYKQGNMWKEVHSNFPPLGLASIASYSRSKGHNVKILDCNIECPSVESFKKYIKEFSKQFKEIKFIGLTAVTSNIKKAYKIAELCKKYYPNSKLVFGGVHATFMSNEVINKKYVDFVVYGEGEITFEELLSNKPLNEIDGLIFKKNKKIIRNNERSRITDLDSMPMPAYDLLPIEKYRPAKGTYKRLPAMSMMTSRGCPGRCTFCEKTLGIKMVFKSAEKVFKEINYLIKNYKIKEIEFYDDTFTVYKKNVLKLCDLITKNKTDITWTCFARVDFIDEEMLKKMKDAGCHQIMYGVESTNGEVLKNINKKIQIEQVVKAVKWTKNVGIECRVAFMVGNPGDTVEIIKENIKFVNEIDPDLLVVNITTPFPGTAMFDWAKSKNLLLTYDWDDYDLSKPVMKLENMSANEIVKLYNMMYRGFYLRPSFILKKILSIRSFGDFTNLFEGFKSVLSFLNK